MSNPCLYMDTGYSSLKAMFNGRYYKIPTAIAFSNNMLEGFSDQDVYQFENQSYIVGELTSNNTFVTSDSDLKLKFEPLIIKKFRDTLDIPDSQVCNITLSLALTDWKRSSEMVERCKEFEVNGNIIKNNISLIPQGIGAYYDYIDTKLKNIDPENSIVIDIGFNTINFLVFKEGLPVKSLCKGYPGHGLTSVITPFSNQMENYYGFQFSVQECVNIFSKGYFNYKGESDPKVVEMIEDSKNKFIQNLFNSVLINDKKLINTSDVTIVSGGGSYILNEFDLPSNFKLVESPYEYSNVRGMSLINVNGANDE